MAEKKSKTGIAAKGGKSHGKVYTEEQVNAACQKIYQDMVKKIREMDLTNMFRRLDYLFMVLQNKNCFNDNFVASCAHEVEVALTIEEEPAKETKDVQQ